ncbi:hypothetical protein MOX02_36450 [Methylobacterium oxalidis]|uniref:DUF2336 domain-containing protein n=2 Tax=Methylobacterium oxalidis TaxID=944322 RepID=A0A512J6L9_9HYPH|nr:hypothetical protein MOX02_36450 [Methylobacterium oxalidis]GLS65413.1 hypothetical protein GCM10007888_37950 [Methylobacterium oxalidis]
MSPTAARVYDEALLRLARAERTDHRVQLSRRLAPVEAGPVRTVTDLAYDLDPEIAAPVLRHSVLLRDEDLVAIAQTRSQGHLGALAERREVSEPVTDVVVIRGSWPVLRQLAANRTAHLSAQGLARLTVLSRGDGHITVALTKRSDVPAAVKGELLSQFKEMAVARRSSFCGEHSGVSLDAESSDAAPFATAQGNTDPLSAERLRAAGACVDAIAQSRPLTCAEVPHALARGELAEAIVMVARLAEQEPDTLVQALRGLSPVKNLALLAMRSADLSWAMAERILREVGSRADREGNLPALNEASQRGVCRSIEPSGAACSAGCPAACRLHDPGRRAICAGLRGQGGEPPPAIIDWMLWSPRFV